MLLDRPGKLHLFYLVGVKRLILDLDDGAEIGITGHALGCQGGMNPVAGGTVLGDGNLSIRFLVTVTRVSASISANSKKLLIQIKFLAVIGA